MLGQDDALGPHLPDDEIGLALSSALRCHDAPPRRTAPNPCRPTCFACAGRGSRYVHSSCTEIGARVRAAVARSLPRHHPKAGDPVASAAGDLLRGRRVLGAPPSRGMTKDSDGMTIAIVGGGICGLSLA